MKNVRLFFRGLGLLVILAVIVGAIVLMAWTAVTYPWVSVPIIIIIAAILLGIASEK